MRKTIYTVSILWFCMSGANAQTMTYNHDASKQAQIEVMEVGAGSLTPELYYKVTHHNYWEGAKATTSVKNTLRLATNAASIPQVEYADSIQADLEGRAKIEAARQRIAAQVMENAEQSKAVDIAAEPVEEAAEAAEAAEDAQ